MNRPTVEVADIFRAQSDNFIDQHILGIQQLKVIRAITRYRTAALGGHTDVCPNCQEAPVISYNTVRKLQSSPTTAAATGIATSASPRHASAGWTPAARNCFRRVTSMSSLRYRTSYTHWCGRIRRNSTISCSARWPKRFVKWRATPNIWE